MTQLRSGRGHRRRPGAHRTTRTRTSSPRTCSPSPTGWAATAAARSPARWRSPRSRALHRPHGRRPARGRRRGQPPSFEQQAGDPDLAGMGTTIVVIAVVRGRRRDELAFANVGDSPGLPAPRRRARAGQRGPQPRGRDGARRPAHPRRSRRPPAPQHRDPGARHRAPRRRRHLHGRPVRGRPLRAVQRRPLRRGRRRPHRRRPAPPRRPPRGGRELVRLANEGGGRDNITVVVVDVVDDDDRAGAASAAIGRDPSSAQPRRPRRVHHRDRADGVQDGHGHEAEAQGEEGEATPPQRFTWRVAVFLVAVRRRPRRRRPAPSAATPATRTSSASPATRSPSSRASPAACCGSTRRSRSAPASPAPRSRPALARLDGRPRGADPRRGRDYVENLRERDRSRPPRRPPRTTTTTTTTAPTTVTPTTRRSPVIASFRRNTELGLIVLAVLVTGGAYTLASLGRTASLPANIGPFLGVVLGLLVAAHIATRRLAPAADAVLLPLAALLNGIGYVFIARLDEDLAGLQATWTLSASRAFIGTLIVVRRVRDLQRYRYTFMLIGLALLLLPLVPGVGREINGARIWATRPAQLPARRVRQDRPRRVLRVVPRREARGARHGDVAPLRPILPDPKHLGPVLLAWGVSLVVMTAEKDLGSSLLFFALFIVMLWVATERTAYLGVGAVLFGGGAAFAYSTFTHVQERVSIWLDPWQDPSGDGFQVIQSWFAMAWGGMAGTGLGLGNPDRIPVAETDFIFAAIGEELGLLGSAAVIVAFVLMVGSGLRIAVRADAPFEKLLATGLTILLGVQSFIIMAGVTRLLPLTGVTLPFVSYGGSSLVANYVLLALLVPHLRRRRDRQAPMKAAVNAAAPARARPARLLPGAVRDDQLRPGVPGRRPQRQPAQHPPDRARLQPPRGQIITADGAVLACTVPAVATPAGRPRRRPVHDRRRSRSASSSSSACIPRATCSVTSPATSTSASAPPASRALQRRAGRPDHRAGVPELSDLFVDRDRTGDVTLTTAQGRAAAGPRRARRPQQRLGRGHRPPRRLDPRAVEHPVVRPEPARAHDTTADDSEDVRSRPPRPPAAGPHVAGAVLPGSTFKVVTGSVGVETGVVTPSRARVPGSHRATTAATDRTIQNFGGETCGGTLFDILRVSCNSAFAQMGPTSGPSACSRAPSASASTTGRRSTCPPRPRRCSPTRSSTALPVLAQSPSARATSRPRRCRWRSSPAIANNGIIMRPHVMAEVRDDEGEVIKTSSPSRGSRRSARRRRQLMREAMRRGRERHGDRPACDPASRSAARPAPRSSTGNPDAGVARVDHRIRRPTRAARRRSQWPSSSRRSRGSARSPAAGWPRRSRSRSWRRSSRCKPAGNRSGPERSLP